MTGEIILMLAILGTAILFFITDWLRVDVVAILILLTLALTGLVTPAEAFSGFSSPAVITVWAIFIVSGGLYYTGVANLVGERVLKLAGTSQSRLVALLMAAVGLMSSVMNNVGATAVLLPAVVTISRRLRINASRILLPLAYGSLLGGMTTLIGTPPNILASNALQTAGLKPFTLFDFAPVGGVAFLAGTLYMAFFGRRLLPDRTPLDRLGEPATPDVDWVDLYRLGERLFRARIPVHSPLIGKTLALSGLREEFDLSVVALERRGESQVGLDKDTVLRRGDVLLVEGLVDHLAWAQEGGHLELQPELGVRDRDLQSEVIRIAEAILSPHSRVVGKTLTEIQFRDKYQLNVLAILRDGKPRRTGLADLPLQFGDTLLVQGSGQSIRILQRERDYVVLNGAGEMPPVRMAKAPVAAALIAVMLVPVLAGWLPISAAALLAGMLMVLTGCLTMDEAYQSIEWKAVFLVAGTLPLGIAMEKSGTAQYLSSLMVDALGGLGPHALLAGFFFLTNLLTQFMSNAASTVLIAPIAIGAALQTGVEPHGLVLAVAVGASAGFLTPVAHQSNILVMGPGGYRFGDYLKAGLTFDLIALASVLLIVPLLWS